jgi:hypothetical protein
MLKDAAPPPLSRRAVLPEMAEEPSLGITIGQTG